MGGFARDTIGRRSRVFEQRVEQALHALEFFEDDTAKFSLKIWIIEMIGQQVQEGLHRNQRIANLVRDFGQQAPHRGQSIEAADLGVEFGNARECSCGGSRSAEPGDGCAECREGAGSNAPRWIVRAAEQHHGDSLVASGNQRHCAAHVIARCQLCKRAWSVRCSEINRLIRCPKSFECREGICVRGFGRGGVAVGRRYHIGFPLRSPRPGADPEASGGFGESPQRIREQALEISRVDVPQPRFARLGTLAPRR